MSCYVMTCYVTLRIVVLCYVILYGYLYSASHRRLFRCTHLTIATWFDILISLSIVILSLFVLSDTRSHLLAGKVVPSGRTKTVVHAGVWITNICQQKVICKCNHCNVNHQKISAPHKGRDRQTSLMTALYINYWVRISQVVLTVLAWGQNARRLSRGDSMAMPVCAIRDVLVAQFDKLGKNRQGNWKFKSR